MNSKNEVAKLHIVQIRKDNKFDKDQWPTVLEQFHS